MFRGLLAILMCCACSTGLLAATVSYDFDLQPAQIQFLTLPVHSNDLSFALDVPTGAPQQLFFEQENEGYRVAIAATVAGRYTLIVDGIAKKCPLVEVSAIAKPEKLARKTATPAKGTHPLLDEFLTDPTAQSEARFWQQVATVGTPLLHDKDQDSEYMTFLWKGDKDTFSVEILGSQRSFDNTENLLANIPHTNIWFKTFQVAPETVFAYTYSVNTAHLQDPNVGARYYQGLKATATSDPFNFHLWETSSGKFARESHGYGSQAKPHYWSVRKPKVAHGALSLHEFTSQRLNNSRTITLYTPPGTKGLNDNTPIVFITDGERYSTDALTPTAIDNMIDEAVIPPVVAVFIHNTVPSRRGIELPCTSEFTGFMAEELLPWVKQQIPQIQQTKEIVIAGSSYGGLAAACANIMRPDIFNYVLSQSGAFWWYPQADSPLSDGDTHGWVVRRYRKLGCNGDTRFYFDAGQLENNGKGLRSIGENSETLFRMMHAKGCAVTHQRFPGGHDLYHWKETIAHGLIALLGHKVAR